MMGTPLGVSPDVGPAKRAAFEAYDGKRHGGAAQKASSVFKVGLVVGDCLLLGLQPVLVHLSKNKDGKFSFNPIGVNLLTELTKTAFALATLLALGTGRPGPPLYRSARAFVADARHNSLLLVPAGLYAVNNYLKFAMQLYFRPTTTKMLGNLKVFTIALLMRTVMRRRFNVIQWEALFLLVAGITVNQLHGGCAGAAGGADALSAAQLLPAALCTLGTITVPSAAGVYNEYALKRHMDTSVHLQNFFLYFFGAAFNALAVLAVCAWRGQAVWAFFAGQSGVTLALIANNAAQGILSSFFYKFADTILKKYSSVLGTIFTALMSWALFSHALTANFAIGVSIVFVSMHQFFTFGDKSAAGRGLFSDKDRHSGGGGLAGAASAAAGAASTGMIYSPSMDHVALTQRGGGGGAVTLDMGGGAEQAPLLPR